MAILRSAIQAHFDAAAKFCLVCVFFLFPLAMAAGYMGVLLTLVLWLLSGRYRARWNSVKSQPAAWFALALYGLVLLGMSYTTATTAEVLLHLSKYSKLLMMVAFLSLLDSAIWRQRCMNAFAAAMLFILGSVYASIWVDLPWSSIYNQRGWGVEHTVIGDRITQSVMMCFFVMLALVRGLGAGSMRMRAFWWACAALGVISLTHLSNGRTGYLLLVTVLLVFPVLATRGRKRGLLLCALAVGIVVIVLTSQTLQERAQLAVTEARTSDRMEITSIGGRVNFWKKTWQLIKERPLTGWGTGSYHGQWCRVAGTPEWCHFGSWHPHNQFLFFWVENGILAMMLFAGLVLAPVWTARKANPTQRQLLVGFAAVFLIDSMINAPLWSSRENHFFMFMMALLLADTGTGAPSRLVPGQSDPGPQK